MERKDKLIGLMVRRKWVEIVQEMPEGTDRWTAEKALDNIKNNLEHLPVAWQRVYAIVEIFLKKEKVL